MTGRICKTNRGETVCSRYEKMVADFLDEHSINYLYEPDYHLSVTGETVIPDFCLSDYNVYIEVWGLAGDPDYNEIMNWKKSQYEMDDIRLIELWPEGGRLNFRYLIMKKFEELTGKKFPAKKWIPYFPPDRFNTKKYSRTLI